MADHDLVSDEVWEMIGPAFPAWKGNGRPVAERRPVVEIKPSLPGRYVSLKALMPDGVHQSRRYSLTRADDREHREFAVKRVHGGNAPDGEVSNLLHGEVHVGEVDLPADAEYYLCGPLPFMQSVRSGLIDRGVRPQDIQYEVFGPDLWLADFQ